jgi:shikimate kinase
MQLLALSTFDLYTESMDIIVLTGPKHCGKSSVGGILKEYLNAPYADLDVEIEQRTGKNPRTLFKESEEIFRKAEAEALAALFFEYTGTTNSDPNRPALIIALGGGIIDNKAALAMLKQSLKTNIVYLELSAESAWQRIKKVSEQNGGVLPPFLDTADPQKTHRDLHNRRAAAYRSIADIIVQCEGKNPEEIAAEIRSIYRK